MEYKCFACQNENLTKRSIKSRTETIIDIYFCDNCGHGRQYITKNYDIYSTGVFSEIARNESKHPSPEKIKELDKKAYKRYQFYKKHFDGVNSSLEIGSSIGSFVHLMKLTGIDAVGIEPDPVYAEHSKGQYGFSQKSQLFEEFQSKNTFDLVYSFHVIEHVPEISEYIKKSYEVLNPNGKILIECPSWDLHSFGDINFTVWEPHLQYFTLASMYALLSKHKFKLLEINFIGSAIYAVAEKTNKSTFDPKQFTKLRRRYSRTFFINDIFPKIPFKIKGTEVSKLFLQYLFSKNNRSFNELAFFLFFALRNFAYINAERGIKRRKAFHVSYFSGWENAGDTVLSKCVRKLINTRIKIGWNLARITDPVKEETVAKINRSDFILIGGGGVLLPDSNPNSISGWQWAIKPDYLNSIKKPVIVYAIGYNFFKGQQNSELFVNNLEHLVRKADFFSLRNQGSIRKVKEIIPNELHSKIEYQPCPTTIISKLYPSTYKKKKSNLVGINIAYDRYEMRYGKDIYLILDQIANALLHIEKLGFKIINVCHLENDRKFEISLDKMKVNYQTINLQYKLPGEVYSFYNELEIMIGTRGHAQMIPFGLNSKILSLGTHEKLRYFLEDINSMDWYIDVHKDPNKLSDQILEKFNDIMFEKIKEVEERLRYQQEILYQQSILNLRKIENILLKMN